MKANTEKDREKARSEAKEKAENFLKQGNTVLAHKLFASAVDITPEMAHRFCMAAQNMGIQFIVAPYEADA